MKLKELLAVLDSDIEVLIQDKDGEEKAKNACYSQVVELLDYTVIAVSADDEKFYITIDVNYGGKFI